MIVISLQPVLSQDSSTDVEFIIKGCVYESESILVGECSNDGEVFCSADDTPLLTFGSGVSPGACFKFNPALGETCCPAGYSCNLVSGVCEQNLQDCSYYNDVVNCDGGICQDDCEENGCWWVNATCYDMNSPSLSCSDYRESTACTTDKFHLGQNGAGSEVCDQGYYNGKIVIFDSCKCTWNTTNCNLEWEVRDAILFAGENEKWFECNRNTKVGECLEGRQNISWDSWIQSSFPVSYNPLVEETTETLNYFGCLSGSKVISCGKSSVRLPFFTKMNIFIIIILLILFYILFFNKKKKNKTKKTQTNKKSKNKI